MAVDVRNRNGKMVTLLNPSEKAGKFAHELAYDTKYTNNGYEKLDKKGNLQKLTSEQRAFRAGYLQARKDSSNAFKSKHPRYKRKTV